MLMGLSLMLASAGWAGLVFAHSVLDENQSQELSADLMVHEAVRTVLVNRLAEGMERHVPVDEPMSQQELRSAASEALSDQAAATALRDGLSEAHVLGLADTESETVFSAIDVNEAARYALLSAKPSLQGRILANPLVRVRLPVEGLTWFSGLKSLVDRFSVLALALAVVGFAVAFVLAADPAMILRRAAWWTIASAGIWLVSGPVVAALIRFTVPSSFMIAAVAVESALLAMRNPAIVMASFGMGMASVGALAPAIARRRGAFLLERAGQRDDGVMVAVIATGDGTGGLPRSEGGQVLVTGGAPRGNRGSRPPSSVSDRVSAAWMEGHGYLDDARVAPFFSGSSRES